MKIPHLFIPSKTAILVPEFAVEDLPLDRTTTLVPTFSVKDLSLAEHSDDDDDDDDDRFNLFIYLFIHIFSCPFYLLFY